MIKTCCVVILLSTFVVFKAHAQVVPAWSGGADINNTSFGICFEYITDDYKISKNANWRNPYFDVVADKYVTNGLTSISSTSTPGFGIGFIYRVRLSDMLEARTTPSLVLIDRTLSYTFYPSSLNTDRQVHASMVEMPLLFKIKSQRLGNFRAYIIGGVKYSYEISGAKTDDPNAAALDKLVNEKRGYASYEVGFGFDIYFEYFKFSPEIKISNSFNNVLAPADNPYSSPLDKLLLHSVVFSINLE